MVSPSVSKNTLRFLEYTSTINYLSKNINILLKKAYAKLTALRRLKRLVPANTLLVLYKSFELSHFEYCNSLLIGVNKTLKKKLEDDNHYGLANNNEHGKTF